MPQADKRYRLPAKLKQAFIGELDLDGRTRLVRGIIGKLQTGKRASIKQFYIPSGNLAQARLVLGITITAITDLGRLYHAPTGLETLRQRCTGQGFKPHQKFDQGRLVVDDFSDIVGQEHAGQSIVRRITAA